MSQYFDLVVDSYLHLPFVGKDELTNENYFNIKHNIILSLLASLECLSTGLFIQGGILARSLIEDAFVLLDIHINSDQMKLFEKDKYSTNNLIKRIKKEIPNIAVEWYGYCSRNFAHFGPLHSSPYKPRKCYPDNYVIINGLRNMFFSIIIFHVILEKMYYPMVDPHFFWTEAEKDRLVFQEENMIFSWLDRIKEDVLKDFPLDKNPNYTYSTQTYRTIS